MSSTLRRRRGAKWCAWRVCGGGGGRGTGEEAHLEAQHVQHAGAAVVVVVALGRDACGEQATATHRHTRLGAEEGGRRRRNRCSPRVRGWRITLHRVRATAQCAAKGRRTWQHLFEVDPEDLWVDVDGLGVGRQDGRVRDGRQHLRPAQPQDGASVEVCTAAHKRRRRQEHSHALRWPHTAGTRRRPRTQQAPLAALFKEWVCVPQQRRTMSGTSSGKKGCSSGLVYRRILPCSCSVSRSVYCSRLYRRPCRSKPASSGR